MASPVELPDLPIASVANDADTTLLRQGLTDYQCTVQKIRNINVAGLPPITNGFADASDLLLINRTTNFNIRFSQIGFVRGTKMWFYQASAPTDWSIIPNTGDRLLAVATPIIGASAAVPYSGTFGGSQSGNWQQSGAILNINQIPNHTHFVNLATGGTAAALAKAASTPSSSGTTQTTGIFGTSNPDGVSQAHDHGNLWRPLANVGILCNKDA